MVLKHRLIWLAALVLAACLTGRPALRAPQEMPVAVAFVMDYPDRPGVAAVPPGVVDEVGSALQDHNMAAHPVPFSSYADEFNTRRLTAARLAALAAKANGAKTIVLVETKPAFYSELNNLFRWDVYSKVTIADVTKLNDAISVEKTFPVFMDFEHEREAAVLDTAASEIGDQVKRLANDYLGIVLPAPPTPSAKQSRWDPGRDSIYFVMVDRFSNGDPSNDGGIDPKDPQAFHGGDLQGVINKLDYIQGMGFTTVWLSPVFKMRTAKLNGHGAFHGYWVEDFTKIEPRFGNEEVLVKLSNELHRRGMKLLLDVVLNHVAYDAPLVKEHPDWFHHNGDIKDWNDPHQLETYDVHGLPDLAQEREDVYQYLLKTSLYWIDRVHPDGFRLDAVKHVPASFWARYNEDIRKHAGQDFMLLGEDLDGDPAHLSRTLREGKFTSLFDFPMHFAMVDVFCKRDDAAKLAARLSEDDEYEHPELLATLLDNHDLSRLASSCGGDETRIRNALTFMMLTRGIPTVTWGTEFGATGAGEPENRADLPSTGAGQYEPLLRQLLRFRQEHGDLIAAPCSFEKAGEGAFSCVRQVGTDELVMLVNGGDQNAVVRKAGKSSVSEVELRGGAVEASQGASDRYFHVRPHSIKAWLTSVPARPEAASQLSTVVVRLRNAPLQQGDELFLAGAGKLLGNWDVAHAVGPMTPLSSRMDRTNGGKDLDFRVPLPSAGAIEFKFLLKKRDGKVVWEDSRNRYWFASQGTGAACTWNDNQPCQPESLQLL